MVLIQRPFTTITTNNWHTSVELLQRNDKGLQEYNLLQAECFSCAQTTTENWKIINSTKRTIKIMRKLNVNV